jgi:hypothetical protein
MPLKTGDAKPNNPARLKVGLGPRCRNAFRLCGYAGLALAASLCMILAERLLLSRWVMLAVVAVAVLTFFALALATKMIAGRERLVYYHHQIAVTVTTAVLLWLWRQPLLPYLELTTLGVGLFLACGRVGCFLVGCCHGRPHRLGVCYRAEHTEAGFTAHYVGVRLLPVQLVEALWVFSVVVAGVVFVLRGREPGEALAWYVIMYGAGRFCFEFARGDADRPYHLGFSQPQWTSLALVLGVAALELSGRLPYRVWHVAAAGLVASGAIGVAASRRLRDVPTHLLLHPRHVREVAEALASASRGGADAGAVPAKASAPAAVRVSCTSLGIRISTDTIRDARGEIQHYALSGKDRVLTEPVARALIKLICLIKHPRGSAEVIESGQSVFHVLVRRAVR